MTRPILICLAIILAAIAISQLAGCQHYEPPGQDLWRAL